MPDGGIALPFEEAIDFLRQKVNLPTSSWTDIREAMHARAFVVAGATKAQLVSDFHNSVNRAIAEGRTLEDFRHDFDSIVAKHGWDYNGSRNWRSAVIYNTNMRMAVAAGRWEQGTRLVEIGSQVYIRYTAILDKRTRKDHRDWHGLILPYDHPFWDTHYPPNGWNCRCSIQFLTADELKRYGWEVTKDEDIPDIVWEMRKLTTPEGVEDIRVPEGIDTGFGYNVGKAAWGRGADRVAMARHGAWKPLQVPKGIVDAAEPLPTVTTTTRPLEPVVKSAPDVEAVLREKLRSALGGDEAILQDPTGESVSVGQAIVDHMLDDPKRINGRERFFPFIPELIQSPQEIWVGFTEDSTGMVRLRRRYVLLLELSKDRVLGFVADADGNRWSGLTFFEGQPRGMKNLRTGLRVYKSDQAAIEDTGEEGVT